jgi:6-phosphogluconolactonase
MGFIRLLPLVCLPIACLLLAPSAARPQAPEKMWVFIGTYTGGPSKGIYRFELDLASGKLTPRGLAVEATNPSFLAIHPSQRYLYAVSEVADVGGKKTGGVSAFTLDPKTGEVAALNQQPSGGAGPCHLIVDREGKHVLVANYSGGSASVLPIQADGKLGEATAFVQHTGTSVNKDRQEGPHAHSINLDAANRFAVVADLGLDKVLVYKYDPAKGTLTPNDPPAFMGAPGSGPRHFAFHPNGHNAYVINELSSTLTALSYDPEKGVLKSLQTLSTLPRDVKGNSTAEVQVHPSGKFVYGSNRGHNSIAIFGVDPKTGELKAVGHQTENIKTPRNFGIDPTGTYLVVANQDSNSLVVFRIDQTTGELAPVGGPVEVGKPVCVKMIPMPR